MVIQCNQMDHKLCEVMSRSLIHCGGLSTRTISVAVLCACSYQYVTLISGQRSLWYESSANSFTYNYLPAGDSTLYVCAKDPSQAEACAETTVRVKPASEDYDPTSDIIKMDVGSMSGTGDLGVANDGVKQLTVLSDSTASNSTARRRLLAGQCPSEDTRNAVASKTTQLLALLSDLSAGVASDPAAMRQVGAFLANPV